MIPLKDYNPTSTRSIIVPVIIAVNVIVFFFWQPFSIGGGSAAEQQQQEAKQVIFFTCHASIPYELTHRHNLATAPPSVQNQDIRQDVFVEEHFCPRKNVWLSILYTMFLHGSLLHIGGNMLFLWVFGNNIEDKLGRV